MTTIDTLLKRSQQHDAAKEDYTISTRNITYLANNNACQVVFPGGLFGNVSHSPSDHALAQICQKLKTPPTRYMRTCPPDLRATNLNHWQRGMGDNNWFIRTNGSTVRGVLSDQYVPLDNSDVLETVATVFAGDHITNYTLVRPHVSADSMWVRIVLRDNVGDNYGIGIVIGNDEIGRGSCKVLPFVQRHSCTNSTVWQAGGYEQRHVGRRAREALRVQMKSAILDGLRASSTMYKQVLQAEEERLPNIADFIHGLAEENSWNDHVRDTVLLGTEGEQTRMGVVNGLSFAAHSAENVNDDLRQMLELLSGKLLMQPYVSGRQRFS
ncbi:MAG: hypothetical protein ACPG8W_11070 [Candidatus Promineifilaceae bacterium]